MLLLLGIILGSLNAWRWVSQERQKIDKDNDAVSGAALAWSTK